MPRERRKRDSQQHRSNATSSLTAKSLILSPTRVSLWHGPISLTGFGKTGSRVGTHSPLFVCLGVPRLCFSDCDQVGKRRQLRTLPTKPAVPTGKRRTLEGWGGRRQQVGDTASREALPVAAQGCSPGLPRVLGHPGKWLIH